MLLLLAIYVLPPSSTSSSSSLVLFPAQDFRVCVRTVNEMYDVYHVCLSASPSRAGGEREEREREVAAFFFFLSCIWMQIRFSPCWDDLTLLFFFFFLRKSHTAVCRPSACPYYSMAVMPGSMQASARGCTWYFHPCISRKMTL